ncbi:hypothetical protein [Chroococcus sp. FPU101]|uniref:hypothetical protein n=1 Tax=Chroococcus sp. FPU101 TaxID=1974212 RepID=UPI001A8C5362|nr:hypothetical protein [Chroococcus sp. FPU101]GFE69889.1 hypothetical protein CFPU101_24990 [Chroococcus sp. FPU101]
MNQSSPSDIEQNQPTSSSVEEENSTSAEDPIIEEKSSIRIEIPEPDADNITVLTHKLPNKPILPWNHYDSPWEGSETEHENKELPEDNAIDNTTLTDPSSDEINNHQD